MGNKSEELDYIADVMKAKKDEKQMRQKRKSILNSNNKTIIANTAKNYYKIGPRKIHKNITLDEELVKWINREAKEFNLNFSETVNQILKFSYENSKKK